MRVLFFSNKPIDKENIYNGEGWIYSLINEMKEVPDITIAVAFWGSSVFKGELEGLTLLPNKELEKE